MGFTLPFFNGATRKRRTQIISVDLGSRTTKAVLLERRGDTWTLNQYALLDAPIYDKKISPEQLGDHLHSIVEAMGGTTKFVAAAVGLNEATTRQIEMPQMPEDDMRTVLKMNHKTYLQQDLPGHYFDCSVLAKRAPSPDSKNAGGSGTKIRVLATAAKQQMVADFMQASAIAGLVPDALVPALVGPINAFEQAMPQIYAGETVALVDIGFKHTSISILDRGELATNRVVNIGGDHFTTGLADAKGITYAEAEGIKIGMASEVEGELQMYVLPLGREIRALLDFFEHQQDRPVSQVYISGGSARSEIIAQILHSEVLVESKNWNPAASLQLALPSHQVAEIEHVAPQLTVAIGTALAAY